MRRVATVLIGGLAALGGLGGSCGGGSGDGGAAPVLELRSPLKECFIFGTQFPPGFAFLPGRNDRVWALDFAPPTLIPLDVSGPRPVLAAAPPPLAIPPDSDGDGLAEGFVTPPPIPDDIEIPLPDLGLVTASSYEEVLFLDPVAGTLRTFEVAVPAGFARADNPILPAPGTSAPRTGLSTLACVRPPPGALDSRGDPVATSIPSAPCDAGTPSYLAGFTSGAALVADRLFVSTSNLGAGAGTLAPQYLPGSVLVYDVDLTTTPPRIGPNAATPVIVTSGFNPTHVTAYRAGGRSFALVSVSGAIGIEPDDPSTTPIEAAGVVFTDSAIDVIDAESLELVGTIPLGRAGLDFDRLAIDPTGRVAAVGSAVSRRVFAVDLEPLPALDPAPASPVSLPQAVIFDAADALRIPSRPRGAPPQTCPGQISGYDFNEAGDVLFVNDFCDGTGARIDVDLSGSPPVPVPQSRFAFRELFVQSAPLRADTLGEPRGPGPLEVRPGVPGVDYTGAELFGLVGEPGLLCATTAP